MIASRNVADAATRGHMVRAVAVAATVLLACGLVLAACGKKSESPKEKPKVTSGEVKQGLVEAIDKVKQFTSQQKDEYLKKIASRLDEYDRKLAELKAKTEKSEGKAKKVLEKKTKRLMKKTRTLRRKIENLKDVSAEALAEFKVKVESTLEDMEKLYRKASSGS